MLSASEIIFVFSIPAVIVSVYAYNRHLYNLRMREIARREANVQRRIELEARMQRLRDVVNNCDR